MVPKPSFRFRAIASQGLLGEGERPNSDYDCKIAFVRYALDQNTLPSDLSRIDADLSIIYQSRHAGSATEEVLQAAVADSELGRRRWNR